MPKKKIIEETPETQETAIAPESVPQTRASIGTPQVEIPKVDGPRLLDGVCEFCGAGIKCPHYPNSNGTAE